MLGKHQQHLRGWVEKNPNISFLTVNFQFKMSKSYAMILWKSIVTQFTQHFVGVKRWLYSPLTVTKEPYPLSCACSWEPHLWCVPGCGPAQGLGGLVALAVQTFGEKSVFFKLNFSKLWKEWKWNLRRIYLLSLSMYYRSIHQGPSHFRPCTTPVSVPPNAF